MIPAGALDAPFTCTVDYGVGGAQPGSVSGFVCTGPSHTYLDDGIFTVVAAVTDKDGGTGSNTVSHTVTNVLPTVAAGDDATIDEGSTFGQTGSFTDPGADAPWTGTVDYGDGSPVQTLTVNSTTKTYALSHTYADDGLYTVTVIITDDTGSSSDEPSPSPSPTWCPPSPSAAPPTSTRARPTA